MAFGASQGQAPERHDVEGIRMNGLKGILVGTFVRFSLWTIGVLVFLLCVETLMGAIFNLPTSFARLFPPS
jgi:hypothetical protein